MNTMEYTHIIHPFEPVYNSESQILILGSLPSVKSRENQFYYGHPQNRFWKVIANILNVPVPETIEEKKSLLLENNIALWDVIYECDIAGSSDSSIKNVVPCDIASIINKAKIKKVFCNGQTAGKLYKKFIFPQTKFEAEILPSTSPANAVWTLEKLVENWKKILVN